MEELLKKIRKELKNAEKDIDELMKGKDANNPINNDLMKTRKAMAYENILCEFKKYASSRKGGK